MFKRCIAFLMMIFFLVFSVSCSTKSNNNSDDIQQAENTEGEKGAVITIYLMEKTYPLHVDALGDYEGVKIKAKYFTDIAEYMNKMTTELLSGEGPDIITVNKATFPS